MRAKESIEMIVLQYGYHRLTSPVPAASAAKTMRTKGLREEGHSRRFGTGRYAVFRNVTRRFENVQLSPRLAGRRGHPVE